MRRTASAQCRCVPYSARVVALWAPVQPKLQRVPPDGRSRGSARVAAARGVEPARASRRQRLRPHAPSKCRTTSRWSTARARCVCRVARARAAQPRCAQLTRRTLRCTAGLGAQQLRLRQRLRCLPAGAVHRDVWLVRAPPPQRRPAARVCASALAALTFNALALRSTPPSHSVYKVEAHAAIEPQCIALNAIQRRVRSAQLHTFALLNVPAR